MPCTSSAAAQTSWYLQVPRPYSCLHQHPYPLLNRLPMFLFNDTSAFLLKTLWPKDGECEPVAAGIYLLVRYSAHFSLFHFKDCHSKIGGLDVLSIHQVSFVEEAYQNRSFSQKNVSTKKSTAYKWSSSHKLSSTKIPFTSLTDAHIYSGEDPYEQWRKQLLWIFGHELILLNSLIMWFRRQPRNFENVTLVSRRREHVWGAWAIFWLLNSLRL